MIYLILSMAGCATAPHPTSISMVKPVGGIYHRVERGETLWRISRLYGIDLRTLVEANSLNDASAITSGQLIFIPGTFKKTRLAVENSIAKDSFVWPVKGSVISFYGTKVDYMKNKGIDIKASLGSDVRASRSGKVVFCDEHFKGFGKTLILDHGDNYQTVYSYNADILVKVGDAVKQNDLIAKVGKTGRARESSLHFEIRKDGEPQNPFYYLPY